MIRIHLTLTALKRLRSQHTIKLYCCKVTTIKLKTIKTSLCVQQAEACYSKLHLMSYFALYSNNLSKAIFSLLRSNLTFTNKMIEVEVTVNRKKKITTTKLRKIPSMTTRRH